MNWITTFPKATVMHLGAINSDHAPLLIDTNPRDEFLPRPFRFEAMWTRDHCCSEVIKEAWKTKVFGSPCFKLARKQESPHGTGNQGDLFAMNDQKALGNDGLPAMFYKRYWATVGLTVTAAIQSFFSTGKMLKEINNTLLVLIPKNSNPSTVNHFRPISLCNTVYKVISKLLVARVRPVLDKLISPCQSAFIPGKWIAENQITIHELLHSFKRRKVKGGFMALKIDLQKAYDRINWGFLKAVLENFGFPDIFVNWIMECISSVSFSILINGGKSNFFTPTRGLRQGDPLSPYLFILCQEVLSRIIEREHATGSIQGVKMNVGGPSFTNVMYADDIMLFAKASRREAAALNTCLEKYCDWSGQLINRDKSGVIFSKLVSREQKRRLKLELEMKCVKKDAVYLGAPLFTMANKSKDFKFLQDKLEARLKGWRCKCLSWAGRSTLIKSVAHAIPSYTFSSFEVPVKVCDNLDATTRRFWWNPRKESGRYLAWKSWEHLCRPKKFGGTALA
uniref:Reverse transcriptase domain-containing protein n=1 Tax=Fagus sylvatica TaxID=28930 RepID=A0A2N9HI63_FAGSY